MKKILLCFIGISFLALASCKKDGDDNVEIEIDGFQLTDALGNQVGLYGHDNGDDWQMREWSELSAKEQAFLNFSDAVTLTNTSVSTVSVTDAFPNPTGNTGSIGFVAVDSAKVKLVIVDEYANVLKTESFKVKGSKFINIDFSNTTTFPDAKRIRYYFSFSATAQAHFKVGHGDVQVCRNAVTPIDCFE